MPTQTFVEPYPTIPSLDDCEGPIEIMAVDLETGECLARIPEVDPTTGGVDGDPWGGTLDGDTLARFVAMASAAEPPDPIGVDKALAPAHVDLNRALMGLGPAPDPAAEPA